MIKKFIIGFITFNLVLFMTMLEDKALGADNLTDITCLDNLDCSEEYYCAKPENSCNANGLCTLRPEACISLYDPVCGCDGITYSNDCVAAMAGVSIAYNGTCSKICATFDFLTNTLHIPCFNLGNTSYWLDLGLFDYNPLTIKVKNYNVNGSFSNVSECASFDFPTNTFRIPCFTFESTMYELDFGLINDDPILLELKDFRLVTSSDYSKYSGTWDLKIGCLISSFGGCIGDKYYYTATIEVTPDGFATITMPSRRVFKTIKFEGKFIGNTLNISSSNVAWYCYDNYCTAGTANWIITFVNTNYGYGTGKVFGCGICSQLWEEDTLELHR